MEQQQQPVSHMAFLVWKLKRSPRALVDALNLLQSDLPCDAEVHTLMRGGKLIARAGHVDKAITFLKEEGVELHGTLLKLDDFHKWHIILSEEFEEQAARALREAPGSGVNGGNSKDKLKVKHQTRVVLALTAN